MMDALQPGIDATVTRRCHLWRWGPSTDPPEWERRTFVLGGLSLLGVVLAGVTAVVSAVGNERRRAEAVRDAAPRWRYVASGVGGVVESRLVVHEESGAVRSFDLLDAESVDSPAPGWLRMTLSGSSSSWAIQVM